LELDLGYSSAAFYGYLQRMSQLAPLLAQVSAVVSAWAPECFLLVTVFELSSKT
jgi:hypothetical protein